jgi:ADP-ribose pyrophosphatase YjhB (NUDIX family)
MNEIADTFAAELATQHPILDLEVQWPAARLRERVYVGNLAWPVNLVTSARVVVFKGSRVVVVKQLDGEPHIRPGGRLEPGEDVESAARREVLEETGWSVGRLTALGFHHFMHLGERPDDFPFVWRDFIQPIFVAEALLYRRSAIDRSQLEVGSRLIPIGRALAELPAREALLLRAATERRTRI